MGVPQDPAGRRRPGLGEVVRVQGYRGPLIVGASYMHSRPSRELEFASGAMRFTGIDVRWMSHGIQLRGEWVTGRPFLRAATEGWYADAIIHRPAMGPITAMVRVERLDYFAGRFSFFPRRFALGARGRLPYGFIGHVNLTRGWGTPQRLRKTSVDVGLSYSIRESAR